MAGAAGWVDAAGSPEPESSVSRPSSSHGGRHRGTTGALSVVSAGASDDGGTSAGSANTNPGGQSVGATVGSPSPEAKTGAPTSRAATRPPTTITALGGRRLLHIAQTVASGRRLRGRNHRLAGSAEAVEGGQRRLGQPLGALLHLVEIRDLVCHGAVQVARVHALRDDRQPPRGERHVVADAVDGAP